MRRLSFVALSLILTSLTSCGGGGGNPGENGKRSVVTLGASEATYFQQGGLTWSSTSSKRYADTPTATEPKDNDYYCNGRLDGNLDNFNKQAGWRLPTLAELRRLYQEKPKPEGFVLDGVWSSGGSAIDFATGNTIAFPGDAYVTCVK